MHRDQGRNASLTRRAYPTPREGRRRPRVNVDDIDPVTTQFTQHMRARLWMHGDVEWQPRGNPHYRHRAHLIQSRALRTRPGCRGDDDDVVACGDLSLC